MIYAFFGIDCARRRVQYSKCFFLNTFICNECFNYFSNNRYTNQFAHLYDKNKTKNIVFSLKYLFLMEYFDELGSAKSFEIEMKWKWRLNLKSL